MGYKFFYRNCANYLAVALAKTSKHCRDGNRQSPDPGFRVRLSRSVLVGEIRKFR